MAHDKDYQDLVDRIHYSDRYSDDFYEYRHVLLPRQMLKLGQSMLPLDSPAAGFRFSRFPSSGRASTLPKEYFQPDTNVMRLLSEDEWRGIGITQSLGWEHYEVHAPEPHVLLFRREKDYQSKYGNAR
ncbi:hypothetical protein JCM9279_004598 [Rhodotorula babjevae]